MKAPHPNQQPLFAQMLSPNPALKVVPRPMPAPTPLDTAAPVREPTRRRTARREHGPLRPAEPLAERFERFDAEHPEVWAACLRFAREAVAARAGRIGARAILERVRWEALVRPDAHESWKLNNNYIPFYARKLAALPEFEGLLELRNGPHVGAA